MEGDLAAAFIAAEFAETALDLTLSFTPGISWGKDIYEAVIGKNLVTGDSLSSLDRGFAIAGAMSAGIFSKAARVLKGTAILGKVASKLGTAGGFFTSIKKIWTKAPTDVHGLETAAEQFERQRRHFPEHRDLGDFVREAHRITRNSDANVVSSPLPRGGELFLDKLRRIEVEKYGDAPKRMERRPKAAYDPDAKVELPSGILHSKKLPGRSGSA